MVSMDNVCRTEHLMPHNYIPEHFRLQELVDPAAYKTLGERAWQLLDPRLLVTMDAIRGRFGAVICNTWADGGNLRSRGFRSPGSRTGASYSQHRFGRAMDMHFADVTVEEVRRDILQHPERVAYMHITAVELDTSWLHIDLRMHDRGAGLYAFRP